LPARFVENEHIALDIDEPKDLERFLAYGYQGGESTRVAQELLAERGARLAQGYGGA
jgi:bacterioferritin-associated ferredoxin